MWPGQRLQLAVWADELQTRGERLGELIATSLRADELTERARLEPNLQPEANALAEQTEQLRRALAPELLGVEFAALAGLRLRWRCGVVRALELDPAAERAPLTREQLHEHLAALARRPVMRWLDRVVIERPSHDLDSVLHAFAAAQACAHPRLIVMGRWPGSFRRIRDPPGRPSIMLSRVRLDRILIDAPSWGLTWLLLDGDVQALPWAKGGVGDRLLRLDELLAAPWSEAVARRLACACWDGSIRVRERVFAALPELPDEAAPLVMVLLAQFHSQRGPGGPLDRAATRIASSRPEWVAAVAHNFSSAEPWAARWLAGSSRRTRAEASAAIPEIHAMIVEHEARGQANRYHAVGLRQALAGFPKHEPPPVRAPSAVVEFVDDDGALVRL